MKVHNNCSLHGWKNERRDVRAAEGARLEIVCTPPKVYRGFKSRSLRQYINLKIAGPRATTACEPRQVRKEAAVAVTGVCCGQPGYPFYPPRQECLWNTSF